MTIWNGGHTHTHMRAPLRGGGGGSSNNPTTNGCGRLWIGVYYCGLVLLAF